MTPYFVSPSAVSTGAFILINLSVLAMVVVGIRRVAPRWTRPAIVGSVAWVATFSLLSSALTPDNLGPLLWVLCSNLTVIALAASRVGKRLAALPDRILIGFQAFRLPLELVLHAWVVGGTLPAQMTWSGRNLDVITGAAALLLVGLRRPLRRPAVWAFELLGLGLLVNVIYVAARSAPTSLRSFLADPPLLLPYHLPYAWIVPVCVGGALFGHLVLLRRLLGK